MAVEAPDEVRSLGVRWIHIGGQPTTDEFRRLIESAWGAKVIDAYVMSEFAFGVAGECRGQCGLHVSETACRVEIVDPATGGALPDGEEGEVVITSLARRGMPLVRYRTADIAHLLPWDGRCRCGMAVRRMSHVRGRLDDLLIVGGDANIWPDEIDRAVFSVPGVTDYQLVVEKESYRDVVHLTVERDGGAGDLRETMTCALLGGIPYLKIAHDMTRTLVFGRIERAAPGALSAGRPKTPRIIDRRAKPPPPAP
jgi:phenylacetate-CoA ligase